MKLSRRALLGTGFAFLLKAQDEQDDWQGIAKVVAIGDVHGDRDALAAVLRMAGLIDEENHWIGGKTHLVQLGDVPARGAQTRLAFDLLMQLEKEAAAAGGRVHALIGNHDAGVMYGDLRSVLPEEYLEFRGPDSDAKLQVAYEKELENKRKEGTEPKTPTEVEYIHRTWFERHPPGFVEHQEAFGAAGYYGSWIRKHNAVVRINDTLFLHGGISPKHLKMTRTAMNRTIRQELSKPENLPPGLTTDIEGPLWYRGLIEQPEAKIELHLQAVLRAHGVKRIVLGHTVTRTAILPRCGSRIVDADIGLSRFYGRPPACLVLEGKEAYVIHRGTKIPLPGAAPAEYLTYLKAVAAADVQPSPVDELISKLTPAK